MTALIMPDRPKTENNVMVGEPPKISVAQVLVYELRVHDAMTRPAVTAGPADSLRTIQHLMKSHRISAVPIVANGALVGIIATKQQR